MLSHPYTFLCSVARQPSFASLPAYLAACWQGDKRSCSYRNERVPMQNSSGATGIVFNYPLFCHGKNLIPAPFGQERRNYIEEALYMSVTHPYLAQAWK